MYLCDAMKGITDSLPTNEMPVAKSAYLQWMHGRMSDILSHAELFTMERSALAAAGHLKLGDPNRILQMMELVFDKPGRIFIEASHKEREEEFSNRLMGIKTTLPDGRFIPKRIGIDVTIHRKGVATIQPVWIFPKYMAREVGTASDSRLFRETMRHLSMMGISMGKLEVDLSKAKKLTLEEFRRSSEENGLTIDLRESVSKVLRGREKISDALFWRTAWNEKILSTVSRFKFDDDAELAVIEQSMAGGVSVEEAIESAMKDLDGELMLAVGLLAVLQARKDTDVFVVEPRKARKSLPGKRASFDHLARPFTSIVRLGNTVRLDLPEGQGEGAPGDRARTRARHAVSGHLFLARNGKMVWRKAHFRGSIDAPRSRRIK